MLTKNIVAPYTLADIESATCKFFNITRQELYRRSPKRHVSRRRWVVVHLARLMTNLSQPDLARRMMFRDHTTVLHAQRRAIELVRDDTEFAHTVLGVAQVLFHLETEREKFRAIFAPPPPPMPAAPALPSHAAFALIGGAL
jgi:hypothetical protein